MLLYKSAVFAFLVTEQVTVIVRVSHGLLGLSSAKHSFPYFRFFYSGWLARNEP